MISLAEVYSGISGEALGDMIIAGIQDISKRDFQSIRVKNNSKIPDKKWDSIYPAIKRIDHKPHPFNFYNAKLGNIDAGDSGGIGKFYMPYMNGRLMKARGANFDSANVSYGNFEGMPAYSVDREDQSTDLRSTRWVNADMSYANLKHTLLNDAMLAGTNLVGADLEGSNITGACCYGTRFEKLDENRKVIESVKNIEKATGFGQIILWAGPPFPKPILSESFMKKYIRARRNSDIELFGEDIVRKVDEESMLEMYAKKVA